MKTAELRPLGLYIHIPFCRAKCAYCDFVSWPGRIDSLPEYLYALARELSGWEEALRSRRVTSIFLGGGTPSLLTGAQVSWLLQTIRNTVYVAPDAEITMEANPGTVDLASLSLYREAGVGRISFGVQAAQDRLLRTLGRIHTRKEAAEALAMARAAGFDNVSVDLMYGLPGQSMQDWEDTLSWTLEQAPEHVSAYSLILEEGTRLSAAVDSGLMKVPDDETVLQMQRRATRVLSENGYARYEISNYAREGKECRHNMIYWMREEYLGLGCAAHSFFNGARFRDPDRLEDYLSGQRELDRETVGRTEAMEEAILLETRMVRGLDLIGFKTAFGEDLRMTRKDAIQRMRQLRLAEVDGDHLKLTERGMELQNAVVSELVGGGFA